MKDMTLKQLKSKSKALYEKVLEHSLKEHGNAFLEKCISKNERVHYMFTFDDTEEGHDFWAEVIGWRGEQLEKETIEKYNLKIKP